MKPNQLATLVLRLMGIYCLIQAIPMISFVTTAVSFASSPTVDGEKHVLSTLVLVLAALLPFAFRLGVGILLLKCSVTWGERLMPKDVGEEKMSAITFEQFQVLAFAIAGILVFADALPSLFRSILSLVDLLPTQSSRSGFRSGYNWHTGLTTLGILAQAVLGLLLFFRAHWIANFWRLMRDYVTAKPPQV